MDYAEKLKNPKWQKKRLEIMERDDWKCQICSSKKNSLTVHHIRYMSGYEPWNYPESLLITLCENCHDFVHERGRWEWVYEYEQSKKNNIICNYNIDNKTFF